MTPWEALFQHTRENLSNNNVPYDAWKTFCIGCAQVENEAPEEEWMKEYVDQTVEKFGHSYPTTLDDDFWRMLGSSTNPYFPSHTSHLYWRSEMLGCKETFLNREFWPDMSNVESIHFDEPAIKHLNEDLYQKISLRTPNCKKITIPSLHPWSTTRTGLAYTPWPTAIFVFTSKWRKLKELNITSESIIGLADRNVGTAAKIAWRHHNVREDFKINIHIVQINLRQEQKEWFERIWKQTYRKNAGEVTFGG